MRGFYTTHEAASLLSVSLPTVVNWIEARRLRAHRTPGGHRRIARDELAAFMLRHGMPLPAELSGAVEERRKVLIIGAEGPGREGMVRRLAGTGYAVEQTSPGFAGGLAAARFRPDLVVLDAPSADGGEILRELSLDREDGPVPVVGVGPAAWSEELVRSGCAAAVAGPPGEGALEAAVAQVLAGIGQAREAETRRRRRRV